MSTFLLKIWFTCISQEWVACICHAVSVLNWAWHLLKGWLFAVALVNTRLVCDGESNPCQSHNLLHLPREIPRPSVNTSPHSSSVVCPQGSLSSIKAPSGHMRGFRRLRLLLGLPWLKNLYTNDLENQGFSNSLKQRTHKYVC